MVVDPLEGKNSPHYLWAIFLRLASFDSFFLAKPQLISQSPKDCPIPFPPSYGCGPAVDEIIPQLSWAGLHPRLTTQ